MINTKRLKTITELNLAQRVSGDDVAYDYSNKLVSFTDEFPAKEEALRDAVADGNTEEVIKCLTSVNDMLLSIGADNLSVDCARKITEIPSMQAGSIEAYVENFLSTVSSLSIDIQMAVYDKGGTASNTPAGINDEGIKILAVDDNSFFLNTIKTYLSDTDYKLTCVTSGSTALRYLQKHSPNLLIFDIDMPEMDGYELAEKARSAGATAPIIFLTGNASKEYVVKAVKAGAVDFIVKPISKEKTLNKIARYINEQTQEGM